MLSYRSRMIIFQPAFDLQNILPLACEVCTMPFRKSPLLTTLYFSLKWTGDLSWEALRSDFFDILT